MQTLGSLALASCSPALLSAQQPGDGLSKPVFRVSRANSLPRKEAPPLDQALQMAREGLGHIRRNIDDFTAVIVKRERINGTLGDYEYMFAKIRNRKVSDGQLQTPLGVYLVFLKPSSVKGREVIYVEGRNDNKLTAHEGGFKGRFLPTVSLQPTSGLAMRGQRYPLTDIGIENLIVKLIERGETARQYPDIECSFRQNAKIKDRSCTVIELTQPTKRPDLDFHKAQIFIDDEHNIPLRYVAYDWPSHPGAPLEVIEEYTYLDVKLNVGLTAADFDAHNAAYNFYSD
jgi:hypothetical protein